MDHTIDASAQAGTASDMESQFEQLRAEMEARFQTQQEENQRLREQLLEQAHNPPIRQPRSVSFAPPHLYESIEEPHRPSLSRTPSISHAARIENIPNLSNKLLDGLDYSPRLWEVQVKNSLERFSQHFYDDTHRKDWLLAQTEGTARSFLEPFFSEAPYETDALALVGRAGVVLSQSLRTTGSARSV